MCVHSTYIHAIRIIFFNIWGLSRSNISSTTPYVRLIRFNCSCVNHSPRSSRSLRPSRSPRSPHSYHAHLVHHTHFRSPRPLSFITPTFVHHAQLVHNAHLVPHIHFIQSRPFYPLLPSLHWLRLPSSNPQAYIHTIDMWLKLCWLLETQRGLNLNLGLKVNLVNRD